MLRKVDVPSNTDAIEASAFQGKLSISSVFPLPSIPMLAEHHTQHHLFKRAVAQYISINIYTKAANHWRQSYWGRGRRV